MTASAKVSLEELEAEIKANFASPSATTIAFLQERLARLKQIPYDADPKRYISCLLEIAWQYYHQGQRIRDGLEPANLAVMLCRHIDDRALLRRALSIESVLLQSTGSWGAAMMAVSEALKIAEEIGDLQGKIAAWINTGAALYQAALYADSIVCADRAAQLASGADGLHHSLRFIALTNVALCRLDLEEYESGLSSMAEAMLFAKVPENAMELLARVFAESNYTRLLIGVGKFEDARARVVLAKAFAAKANSMSADISAACAEALVEVCSGLVDEGLKRGAEALDEARKLIPMLRETLLTLIQAHEKAGLLQTALDLHRELMLTIHRSQQGGLNGENNRDPPIGSVSKMSDLELIRVRAKISRALTPPGAQRLSGRATARAVITAAGAGVVGAGCRPR